MSLPTDDLREKIAAELYSHDPLEEVGEAIDGFRVSPSGDLSWRQVQALAAEFPIEKHPMGYGAHVKRIYERADAILALLPKPTATEEAEALRTEWSDRTLGGEALSIRVDHVAIADALITGDRLASRLEALEAAQLFDLVAHLRRQKAFSEQTFGPGARTKGVVDHIRKELAEIEADPSDLMEWVDVVILAFDGAWRAGWDAAAIVEAIQAKQEKNEARVWPDWRTADPDRAIEHDRSHDAPPPSAARGPRT